MLTDVSDYADNRGISDKYKEVFVNLEYTYSNNDKYVL